MVPYGGYRVMTSQRSQLLSVRGTILAKTEAGDTQK